MRTILLAGLLAGAVAVPPALAFRLPGAEAPLPFPRPQPQAMEGADTPVEAEPATPSILAQALDALAAGDVDRIRAARAMLPARSLDAAILSWAAVVHRPHDLTGAELAAAERELAGWPGLGRLRPARERALVRELSNVSEPQAVVEAFAAEPPETLEGAVLLARAHRSLGDDKAAIGVLTPFWKSAKLDSGPELRLLGEFGAMMPRSAHLWRMEAMLHDERVRSALRVAPLAKAEALARAWAAVVRGERNAGALLEAVPEAERSAGWIFAKTRYLRRKGDYLAAAETLLSAPAHVKDVVDPDAWWVERRVLSREMLDIDKPELAYRIAAAHGAESPAMAADAEFHAGWYALRFLKKPEQALGHFSRIAELTSGAISQSRAFYWMGRAMEAGASGDAEAAYAAAARHGSAYYGQLAAALIGRGTIDVSVPEPRAHARSAFARRPAVAAIRRLEEVGQEWRADMLYREIADQLTDPVDVAVLAAMAERRGDHTLALRIGKIAARNGLEVGALAHPLGAIPASAELSDAGTALAYAIARQESEFNAGAVSGAGARGLLQLLPGTARDVAKDVGLAYSSTRLTSDAAYNATLGAAFLTEQLARFDGSYVLTFVGYNAGPRRARDWVGRYGDPRGAPIEAVVDWVERIPFTETRNYVQRVMENYQVYKMRLSGKADMAADLTEGR